VKRPLPGGRTRRRRRRGDHENSATSSRSTMSNSRCARVRSMRCSAKTAPARARWSNASWAITTPPRATSWSAAANSRSPIQRTLTRLGLGMVVPAFHAGAGDDGGRKPGAGAATMFRRSSTGARKRRSSRNSCRGMPFRVAAEFQGLRYLPPANGRNAKSSSSFI